MEKIENAIKTSELIDFTHTLAGKMLSQCTYPWEALPKIGECIKEIIENLDEDKYDCVGDNVYIAKSASVAPSALICGPTVIGENAEIRHCAYIRGNALIGDGAVVGNSCEVKNAIISDGVQIPHYNYVGDSILGYKSHMGAGAVASNFRLDKKTINVKCSDGKISTGLRKMGVILGDFSEVGCNSVLYPGTVIGRRCLVYPLSGVRGVIESDKIVRPDGTVSQRKTENN
ncbi:MAG: UDP-N-acetylglucosamine pyrophosphorylase [Ruminococcaceae bacterium]|nr:UDP-N-acetylglucosamine pyrophosphorylase [Oscillospiraceae bacterium]